MEPLNSIVPVLASQLTVGAPTPPSSLRSISIPGMFCGIRLQILFLMLVWEMDLSYLAVVRNNKLTNPYSVFEKELLLTFSPSI